MISIIVPIYNEAAIIEQLLDDLLRKANAAFTKEIILVDGGSTDATVKKIEGYSSKNKTIAVKVINSDKGRAIQMNKGARQAAGSILYFLHADSHPPKEFDLLINKAVVSGKPAGCFRMKFDTSHPLLKASQWFTRFNHRACRGGDQSLFVTKSVFEELDGYNESYTVYEDCEFINRIYQHYSFTVLPQSIITSSRKYKANGTYRLQYHFAIIHLKKWTGASPNELSRYYHKYILS